MTRVLATAADARYGYWLLNLIGSVRANSDVFDRVVAYDLGLTPFQRRLLEARRGIEIREVPPFSPHWRQGRTWKAWIWTHTQGEQLYWLDAGMTVLRPLTEAFRQVDERGYFVVSQGKPNADVVPSDYVEDYALTPAALAADCVAAGILGFARDGTFYREVIEPTYEDCLAGRSLGFSAHEVEKLNQGLDRLDPPVVRDCPLFRHEQTVLSIHLYRALPQPVVNDLDRFAGWRSARDHPEQVVWSHRRSGDYRHLAHGPHRFPYKLVALALQLRLQVRAAGLRPGHVVRLARRAAGRLRR